MQQTAVYENICGHASLPCAIFSAFLCFLSICSEHCVNYGLLRKKHGVVIIILFNYPNTYTLPRKHENAKTHLPDLSDAGEHLVVIETKPRRWRCSTSLL